MDKPDLNFLTAEDAENAEGNYALVNSTSWSISFHSEFFTLAGGEQSFQN